MVRSTGKEGIARKRARAAWLLGTTALAVVTIACPVGAAEAGSDQQQVAQAAEEMAFDIAPQAVADAVTAFGRQTGWNVSVERSALSGILSAGVKGKMSPADALNRLLADTGITSRSVGPKAVALEKVAAGGAMVLNPVTVAGSTPSDRPVEGYRATRSTTATKTDTALLDVPQSVTVITQEMVKDQGMRGLGEVLEYVPGIKVGQGEGNRDQLTIRGNNTTADFFTNGMRDDLQYYRDTYNLDRVEALKGSNAMVFGRGGGGGVVNRVLKEADGKTIREAGVQAGSFNTKRATADVGQAINGKAAVRLNTMYENSDSYRDHVELERYGINPTLTLSPADRTKIKLGYEYFNDDRTADRGIPSQNGKPFQTDASTFFGNPDQSFANTDNHVLDAQVEHEFSNGLSIKNHTLYGNYDKFYQNVYANSAVSAAGTYTLAAYNNLTERQNLFNQTDLTASVNTGSVKHKLLTGVEFGRQETHNFRKTASNLANVSAANPTVFTPFNFNTVARNWDSTADVAALYAQDQIDLTEQWQVIGGLRYDRFDLDFTNNLNGQKFNRVDNLLSPRLGVVFKPVQPVSLYTSYSVSYLPSSGDQFESLTATTQALEPEQFKNLEVGAKWDVLTDLALTAAVYRLDRSKTSATDAGGNTVQTGSQRTRGIELGVNGNVTTDWQVAGGYAYQNAEITSTTTAAQAGDSVYQVPRHTVSLWNKYQFTEMWAAGLGAIYQSGMYAAAGNTVSLPDYVRFDAAIYANLTDNVRAQLNVQNLLDRDYYATAHNNNNITPGAPRTYLLSLTTNF